MPRNVVRVAVVFALLTVLSSLATPSFAQTESSIEGHVVGIEDGEIVVDIAGKKGAESGDLVELWRPLKLKHPVTGKIVTDRFRVGSLRLTQVRDALAFAKPEGKLSREPAAGDVIVLRKVAEAKLPAPTPVPGAPAPPVAAAAPAGDTELDPEAEAVTRIFDSLKNADVSKRILAYEKYVRDNPNGRFAAVLYEEAQQLRRLIKLENDRRAADRDDGEPELKSFHPPEPALAGLPLEIGVEFEGDAHGAVLQLRNAGEVAYRPTPMRAAGRGYFVATVPGERMRAPKLEYFIEATTAEGKAVEVIASAERPLALEVNPIPTPRPPLRHEVTLSLLSDFADYNRLKGNDRVWQTEGFVGMRFADDGIRALRTGFGVFQGVGGSLEELDEQKKSGRRVGLTYGYLEGEFAFTSFTALVTRGVLGLRDDGVAGGAQMLIRIGNDKKTNLLIGGEVLGGIGLRGITQLELDVFERIPILLRTEVTNQPAGSSADPDDVRPADEGKTADETSLEQGEVGARAIAQVGYELDDGFVVALRGSYQGRTINHAGPGVGAAVSYTW